MGVTRKNMGPFKYGWPSDRTLEEMNRTQAEEERRAMQAWNEWWYRGGRHPMSEPSLNSVLSDLGWSSYECTNPVLKSVGKKDIFDQNGEFVGAMNAGAVWALLKERGLV